MILCELGQDGRQLLKSLLCRLCEESTRTIGFLRFGQYTRLEQNSSKHSIRTMQRQNSSVPTTSECLKVRTIPFYWNQKKALRLSAVPTGSSHSKRFISHFLSSGCFILMPFGSRLHPLYTEAALFSNKFLKSSLKSVDLAKAEGTYTVLEAQVWNP